MSLCYKFVVVMTQYWISYSKIIVSYCSLICGGLCKKTKLYIINLMRDVCKLKYTDLGKHYQNIILLV